MTDDRQAMPATPASPALPARRAMIIYALCFAAALVEGYDLQSAGVVAPKFVPDFDLSPTELGWVFSASTIGLFFGAAIGGTISDRLGRPLVLITSILLFGLFSILTALAPDTGWFLAARFLTGLGLGGAMPNLIALAAEMGPAETRVTRVAMITAGMPFGASLAGFIAWMGSADLDWRTIFWIGGTVPLLLGVALMVYLPSGSKAGSEAGAAGTGTAAGQASGRNILFALAGEGRAVATLLLWAAFFFTLIVLYLIFNWLPSLLVGRGFTLSDATLGAMICTLGGGIGAIVLGRLVTRFGWRKIMFIAYLGLGVAIYLMATVVAHVPAMLITAFVIGLLGAGAQYVLYALSPTLYPDAVRGTGVGWGIAVGRLGSIIGPMIAAMVLAAGHGPSSAMLAMLPFVALGFLAAIGLNSRVAQGPA